MNTNPKTHIAIIFRPTEESQIIPYDELVSQCRQSINVPEGDCRVSMVIYCQQPIAEILAESIEGTPDYLFVPESLVYETKKANPNPAIKCYSYTVNNPNGAKPEQSQAQQNAIGSNAIGANAIGATLVLDVFYTDSYNNKLIDAIKFHSDVKDDDNMFYVPIHVFKEYTESELNNIKSLYISNSYFNTLKAADKSYVIKTLNSNPSINVYTYDAQYGSPAGARADSGRPKLAGFRIADYRRQQLVKTAPIVTEVSTTISERQQRIQQMHHSPNYVIYDCSANMDIYKKRQAAIYKLLQQYVQFRTSQNDWEPKELHNTILSINQNAEDYSKVSITKLIHYCYNLIRGYVNRYNRGLQESSEFYIKQNDKSKNPNNIVLENQNFKIIIFENVAYIESEVLIFSRLTVIHTEIKLLDFMVDYIPCIFNQTSEVLPKA